MRNCEHEPVFSGHMNLSRRYACICMKCGEHWWAERYDLDRVDLHQYQALRVLHGWAAPQKLPAPPRLPQISPPREGDARFLPGLLFFSALFVFCGLSGVPFLAPWGITETIMPRWMAVLSSGMALLTATVCYIGWKRGRLG